MKHKGIEKKRKEKKRKEMDYYPEVCTYNKPNNLHLNRVFHHNTFKQKLNIAFLNVSVLKHQLIFAKPEILSIPNKHLEK
jgi:hypothetical protein